MARHLMAVCVVCLLCADHLPCHQHLLDGAASSASAATNGAGLLDATAATNNNSLYSNHIPDGLSVAAERYVNTLHLPNEQRPSFLVERDDDDASYDDRGGRTKRHSHASVAEHSTEVAAPSFVRKLFERFGNGDTQTMNVVGFERMLDQLGLYELVQGSGSGGDSVEGRQSNGNAATVRNVNDKADEAQCISSMDLVARVSSVHPPEDHDHDHDHDHDNDHDHQHDDESATPATSTAKSNDTVTATSINGSTSNANQTARVLAKAREQLSLNAHDFASVCPILLYQLTADTSREKAGCIDEHLIAADFSSTHRHGAGAAMPTQSRAQVWWYALLSITIASLCGLLAVAVIPCMESDNYHYMLQFFVSLGVGTLVGDACIHLFSHAMMTRAPHTDEHSDSTLKGLTAACGIAFSFLMERGLTMVSEWRKRIDKKKKPCSSVRVMRDPDAASSAAHHGHQHHHHHHQRSHHKNDHHHDDDHQPAQQQHQLLQQQLQQQHPINPHQPAGEKMCKAKYSSYPYCYDEIVMETRGANAVAGSGGATTAVGSPTAVADKKQANNSAAHNNHKHSHSHNNHNKVLYKSSAHCGDADVLDAAQSLLSGVNNEHATGGGGGGGGDCGAPAPVPNISDDFVAAMQQHHHHQAKHENGGSGDPADSQSLATATGGGVDAHALPQENYTIILREHEAKHHGHSHTHGHVHSPPSSMSAVAWMVIMGDGMHNFTDGMAIGAAFSYNLAGGFSTALAVFCHELPHELGDFAILLKAGMTAKQAIYYNVLSSVLSFIGTVIGIWIGETPEASAWVFAAAAGMFLYIALVDMVPELTLSHKEGSCAYTQLALQMVGMMLGIGIMWLIATYENDLKMIFGGVDPMNDSMQH